MKYLLIRHAQTEAFRLNRIVYGREGAPIIQEGIEQSKLLAEELKSLGINVNDEPVCVSELIRTRQTAEVAGFKNIHINPILNEVNTDNPELTLELVAKSKLPEKAIGAAKAIIANPPAEKIWVTHGLVIAALLFELGVSDPNKFVPDFCEIREIEL
jgi:bisphosphoglycerate-dependent phosphoglycerate mutase